MRKSTQKPLLWLDMSSRRQRFLATQHPQLILAALAYAAYVAALSLSVFAYSVGSYRDVPDPRRLLNGYTVQPKAVVLAALAAERVKAFEANARRHAQRALLWRLSLGFLAVGATLMVVSVMVHTSRYDGTSRPSRTHAYASAGSTAGIHRSSRAGPSRAS